MKKISTILYVFTVSAIITLYPQITISEEKAPAWEVYFSPRGGCTAAIIKQLDHAKASILVQAYSFTSAPIAKALLNAHRRAVRIEVILDKKQRTDKYSSADFLANSGIPVRIDVKHNAQHNKVMVIDREILITGSFNFTKAAEESNAENLLIVRDKQLAEIYEKNWQQHWEHSEPYGGKGSVLN